MSPRRLLWTLALAGLAACVTAPNGEVSASNKRAERQMGGQFDAVPEELGPPGDLCLPMDGRPARAGCDSVRRQGLIYSRHLAVGDSLCLDGSAGGLEVTRLCRVRAAVVDSASGKLLIEIRDAQPGTAYETQIQHQKWFHEAALVALYLRARGYP